MNESPRPSGPPRLLFPLLALAMALCVVGAFFAMQAISSTSEAVTDALTPDQHMDLLSIPEFTLTAQDGRTVTRDDLKGQITLIDFTFSSCPFICPTLNRQMKRAQDALADTNVRFTSFSVDPERDTPEALREHAATIGADPARWTFLTGDAAQVNDILTEGLLLPPLREVESQPIQLKGGESMFNISHPDRFVLLGPEVEVLAIFTGLDPDDVDRAIARARAADAEIR